MAKRLSRVGKHNSLSPVLIKLVRRWTAVHRGIKVIKGRTRRVRHPGIRVGDIRVTDQTAGQLALRVYDDIGFVPLHVRGPEEELAALRREIEREAQ